MSSRSSSETFTFGGPQSPEMHNPPSAYRLGLSEVQKTENPRAAPELERTAWRLSRLRASCLFQVKSSYVTSLEAKLDRLQGQGCRTSTPDKTIPSNMADTTAGPSDIGVALETVGIGHPDATPSDEWLAFNLRRTTQLALNHQEDTHDALTHEHLSKLTMIRQSDRLTDYLHSYLSNIHHDLPFLRPEDLNALHASLVAGTASYSDSITCLVLAIGALTAGPPSLLGSQTVLYLAHQARENSSEILRGYSLESLQLLILHTVFSLLDPYGGNTWHLSGLALSTAIALGLHAEDNLSKYTDESDTYRKAFWSCYILDRCVASATNRPFGIADEDITTQVPQNQEAFGVFPSLCRLTRTVSRLCNKDGGGEEEEDEEGSSGSVSRLGLQTNFLELLSNGPPTGGTNGLAMLLSSHLGLVAKFSSLKPLLTVAGDLVVIAGRDKVTNVDIERSGTKLQNVATRRIYDAIQWEIGGALFM
ncbi:hypothetical protein FE257_000250 [Aspergillus nanangensis]|uniref:Xylanolytic transcriptional activator regulatory domain-containing protein n=1 Tax=Aspergillus nanangensis TaxID=2582783 RepID=A0AAD4GZV4_ASPNN|nr:hypothetical protein FE257_000250 [Aspergillus nanangensis]